MVPRDHIKPRSLEELEAGNKLENWWELDFVEELEFSLRNL